MKDINGKTVKVGDFILYSADSRLNYGKILAKKKVSKYPGYAAKEVLQVRTVFRSYFAGFSKNTVNLNPYGGRLLVIKKSTIPAKLRKGFEENE